jgi:hypothetical protein
MSGATSDTRTLPKDISFGCSTCTKSNNNNNNY